MQYPHKRVPIRALVLLLGSALLPCAVSAEPPRVFALDGARLAKAKAALMHGDTTLAPALARLESEAAEAMERGPYSVVADSLIPPSGDKHDFMSFGPYWWPDPDKPDGLPYIRRDGEVNPQSRSQGDDEALDHMQEAVCTLALAWYYTEKPAYAGRAALLLRTWFLDEATKMNPNLEFGQAIPGRVLGRDIGIIDSLRLLYVVDAIGLIEGASAWTKADQDGIEAWFSAYLEWLLTSKNGKGEAGQHNNHGTWYDAQVASYAFFTGRDDVARKTLEAVKTRRIATQIEPDGRQPFELARTKSKSYSTMNLKGFLTLAALAARSDIDLWNFSTPDGRCLRNALDFLAENMKPGAPWEYQQIAHFEPDSLAMCLRMAAIAYAETEYETLAKELMGRVWSADRTQLLWPLVQE